MNIFLLSIFLHIGFPTFSQKTLEGTFDTRTGAGAQTFIFRKNGTFEYFSGDCFNFTRGKGNYSIQKQILKLNFIGFEPLINSVLIEDKDCKNFDSEKTVFLLKNKEEKRPFHIYDGSVRLLLKFSKKEIGVVKIDNSSKVGSIKIPSIYRDSLVTATTAVDFYKEFSFDFKPGFCKEINVELVEENHLQNQIIKGETIWEYRVKEFSDKYEKGLILHGDTSVVLPNGHDIFLYKRKGKN